MRGHRFRLGALFVAAVTLAGACESGDSDADESTERTEPVTVTRNEAVAVPEVTGPITGGTRGVPYNPVPPELADEHGYVEEEFFLAGEAASYRARGPLGADGKWEVDRAATAPYRTRVLVRRPADPERFNGVVLVEWLNVSAGRDSDADFGFLHPELLRSGYAYAAVSAQQAGVEPGQGVIAIPGVSEAALAPLKEWDPERYGALSHPGDEYSYDIYSQAAQALLAPGEVDPLDGLRPRHVIAAGESQSATRLVTYVDAVHPDVRIYDGFLIHSRSAGGPPLNADPAPAMPPAARIRTDLAEPVLQFQTETDLLLLAFPPGRQPDTDRIVTWEVAGTAHADQATLDYGVASGAVWGGGSFDASKLCGQINTGPQPQVARAALVALRDWVVDGTAPPRSDRLEVVGDDLARDPLGNATGGIRTPAVDAPTSTLTGKGSEASIFCILFGQTHPLTRAQLSERYADHDAYVRAVTDSADAAVEAGHLLPYDRDDLVREAEAARIP